MAIHTRSTEAETPTWTLKKTTLGGLSQVPYYYHMDKAERSIRASVKVGETTSLTTTGSISKLVCKQAQPAIQQPLRNDKLAAVIPKTWGDETEGLVRSILAYFKR